MKQNKQIELQLIALQPNMRNFAYSLTLDAFEADDLVQDTSLRVLNNEEKFTENVNFKGWVLTIMKNIFINNYRKFIRNQVIADTTEDMHYLNLTQNSGIENPESSFYFGEIHKTINSFSEEYRLPFSMHIQGYKYDEIAQKMELPLGTVKSRIFMARKQLQKILKDYRS
jgi:RNA polymerase sigma-70 factor (ECF subfamily)